jgi:nucleotide-binding universal stress UspA family protein
VYRIVVLAEHGLTQDETERLTSLHDDPVQYFWVLIPSDQDRSGFLAAVDDLLLADFRESWEDLRTESTQQKAAEQTRASEELHATVAQLEAAGVTAGGEVVVGDPIPALRSAVAGYDADEVIVLSRPHMVEEATRRDWASRARHELKLPVLRLLEQADS